MRIRQQPIGQHMQAVCRENNYIEIMMQAINIGKPLFEKISGA